MVFKVLYKKKKTPRFCLFVLLVFPLLLSVFNFIAFCSLVSFLPLGVGSSFLWLLGVEAQLVGSKLFSSRSIQWCVCTSPNCYHCCPQASKLYCPHHRKYLLISLAPSSLTHRVLNKALLASEAQCWRLSCAFLFLISSSISSYSEKTL